MTSDVRKPEERTRQAANRRWLREQLSGYFFLAMRDEPGALAILTRELDSLRANRRLILADRDQALIIATASRPGSLYQTLALADSAESELSYAMFSHSAAPLPGMAEQLEILRLEFDRKSDAAIALDYDVEVPAALRRRILRAVRALLPGRDRLKLAPLLDILWLNNPGYVRNAPLRRVAQTLILFHETQHRGGFALEMAPLDDGSGETRVLIGVANPPRQRYLQQVMEVFYRMSIGVSRAYCLTISNGIEPYFLASFYVRRRDGHSLAAGPPLHARLGEELCATQLLDSRTPAYRDFVTVGLLSGLEATLVNAFIAFCHTSLAHCQPDRFSLDEVKSAFHTNPQIALLLVALLRARFDPATPDRPAAWAAALAEAEGAVSGYNTGRRHLDAIRREIFRCALVFIRHTLKTNVFVADKQALAFRLDPAYLAELGAEHTVDLPPGAPFRVTFFFSRAGFGYHVGFSEIARGGWRTLIARSADDLAAGAATLFRETYVLAHTQHAKNKDIYEGGSKMVVLLDAASLPAEADRTAETVLLYKLQAGITSAFLDLFVTRDGVAAHPRVIDYYRQEEAIELGPDENMHDVMIEAIAAQSNRRGYLLGSGIMSSKQVGINHKEYGVTSTGVITFADIVLAELGIDLRRDPFRVKLTGGPNGDVAGNALRLLLERAPAVRLVLILDGTAALADPAGADHDALRRIVLNRDLDAFDPQALHPGGMLLLRSGSRRDGLKELFRRVSRTEEGELREEWISSDEFARQYGELVFTVPAELFIPAGGRPETIDRDNWPRFLGADGSPSARAIVEGANSFLTPEARVELQRRGVLIMRDASANKCGVISSSYEIIANLLLSDAEFMACKERYVGDVLRILERRAGDEARLILKRRRAHPELLCTEISDALSGEINGHYARLFAFFQERPELTLRPPYRAALLAHLPALLREEPRLRRRLGRLPARYRAAILAAEIGSSLVYRGDREAGYQDLVRLHLHRYFSASPAP